MRAALALAAIGLLASAPSAADVPPLNGDPRAKVRSRVALARSVAVEPRATTTIPPSALREFAPFAATGWRAIWDRDTGVPIALTGSYLDAAGASRDPAIAERMARNMLARYVGLLAPGSRSDDFVAVANHSDGELRTVALAQTWRGFPVHGAAIGFVFQRDRLFAITSSARPHVSAVEWPARSQRRREVLASAGGYVIVELVEGGAGAERWTDYVDRSGAIALRESHSRSAAATLKYSVGKRYAAGERFDAAASTVVITVNGGATTTNSSGAFAWSGTNPATVVPSVDGSYVSVHNYNAPNVTASLTAEPGKAVVWDFAGDELGDAQLSAYIYISLAKARARVINPSLGTWFDEVLPVYVNEPAECNAIGNITDVHFQRAGGGCENTARVADIAFHEFGHTFHFNSVIMGIGDANPSLAEGLADFFAANLTEDSGVGRGLHGGDAPLRDIDPNGTEFTYPENFDEADRHGSGRIVSGALWDLRKALIRKLGVTTGTTRTERIFTGLMQRARDIPATSFTAAQIADDDDGNLGNGTPNYCELERAFGRHGLVPGYVGTTVQNPVVDDLDVAVTVDTPAATSCPPLGVVAITVTWRPGDGVASTFELAADGATWRGAFPSQPDYTTIAYSIDVIFDDGSVQTFPNNPADPLYQLFVGTTVPIMCASFDDDPQWEQTSTLGFEWNWAMPNGANDGDPALPYTGTHVLGTNVNGLYRPLLIASIATPPVAIAKYERVHLQYRRWLTVENAQYDQATIVVNDEEAWRNAEPPGTSLDHIDREWRFHDLDLTRYVVGDYVQVRWGLATDHSKELGGWTLDDVCIVGINKLKACGDGEVDLGEQCDDGNTRLGDGCDDSCHYEITAGGGGCHATRSAASWWLVLLSVAIAVRARGRRGRSRCASRSTRSGRAGRRESSA